MSPWKEVTLIDVISVLGDGLHGTPKYDDNGEYYFINGNNLCDGKVVIKSDTRRATKDEFEKYKKNLNERTILVSINGTIGNVALYNNENCILGKSACYFNVKEGVDKYFIKYIVCSKKFQDYINSNAHGTTIMNVSLSTMREFPFLLPDLPTQIAIASILSSLDNKIDLLHRQNKTLEQLAETLFRQWFVEEAKEGWEEFTLDEVCIKVNSGGTPSTKVESYYNGEINWYSTKELNDNILLESKSKISIEGLENSAAKLFPANTIIIAIYAAPTVGRLGILGNEASFNQAACGFIANEDKICFEYLYLHLLSSRQKLNDMASGSAQQNLNVGIMKEFEIIIPPVSIMNNFRDIVRPMFQKIKANTVQIRSLTLLRDTLLPKLMSGEIRVNN